jgi:hypothetical protein
MVEKKYKLSAHVSSDDASAIKSVLERMVRSNGTVKQAADGFEVKAELKGESARDLNRMFLSELRRAEKKTRLRAEWTLEGTTEKFFDYAHKATVKSA